MPSEKTEARPEPAAVAAAESFEGADEADQAIALMERGVNFMQAGDFLSAIEDFRGTRRFLDAMFEEGEAAAAAGTADEDWEEEREALRAMCRLTDAHLSFALGQADRLGRNPGAAIAYYDDAAKNFERLHETDPDPQWLVLSKYNRVLSIIASGLEKLFRADPTSAASEFLRAQVALGDIVEETIPAKLEELDDDSPEREGLIELRDSLVRDLEACRTYLHLARFRDESAKGNWAAALSAGEELCTNVEQQLAHLPDETPKWLRYQLQAELQSHLANREIIRGHVLKEEGDWADALQAYRDARAELLRSAESYLKTGLPTAQAAQESSVNQASTTIDVFIRQCETERRLREEIDRLRHDLATLQSSLLERLKDRGITNVTTQASVMATIDQDAQIVQHVEVKVREALSEARVAIDQSSLEPAVKDELRSEASALLASEEKGPGFLDKAKAFTEKISAVVNNAAEAAGPLVPVAKALALLLL